jgi:hypothetical protein
MLIIPTSAEINSLREMRVNEYLKTINWMKKNIVDCNIIFLECVSKGESYIENHYPVYYSSCHNESFLNKGANLGLALKRFFHDNQVTDDLIVQFTGRYNFIDKTFFYCIKDNPNYDFYGKLMGDQYFTGCFAMKKYFMVEWLNTTDWENLNQKMINIEKSLRDYVIFKKLNCYHLDKINIDCNIFGNGTVLDRRTI